MKALRLFSCVCAIAYIIGPVSGWLEKGEVFGVVAQTDNPDFDGQELQVMRNGSVAVLSNGYPFRAVFFDEFSIVLTPEPLGVLDIDSDESLSIVKTLYSPTRGWRERDGALALGREKCAFICPSLNNRLFWSGDFEICSDAISVELSIVNIVDEKSYFMDMPRYKVVPKSQLTKRGNLLAPKLLANLNSTRPHQLDSKEEAEEENSEEYNDWDYWEFENEEELEDYDDYSDEDYNSEPIIRTVTSQTTIIETSPPIIKTVTVSPAITSRKSTVSKAIQATNSPPRANIISVV